MPDGTLDTRIAAAAGGTAQAPRLLGLILAVIVTAQLMIVLDLTIVNVALPHIQAALGFSGSNLEWVVNAYAVAFGGLLLLGGRSGDLLERRRVFIAGLLLFTLASLLGGFATDQAWLITARAVQGAGAAMAAPTALSLIAVTRVLPETGRGTGRFDLPGAVTATAGVAALVYGLSNAATTPDGVSHWGDAKVVISLAAAAVLLAAFVVIETRSRYALLPMRLMRSRDRSGAFLISLCLGTATLGMFFSLTLFIQEVWGYSALRSGVAYLPYVPVILVMTVVAQRGVSRIGARPLLITGCAIAAGGMFWMSRISEHSTYVSGMLGPTLVLGTGLGLVFGPVSLVILNKVTTSDAGAASSLNNVGQQVGGSIGLAIIGTVAWSAVAGSVRSQAATAARGAVCTFPLRRRPGCMATHWQRGSPGATWSRRGSWCWR